MRQAVPFRLNSPVLDALDQPDRLCRLGPDGWNALLRSARRHRLAGRLAVSVEDSGLQARLPARAYRHLVDARRRSDFNATVLRFEAGQVLGALARLDLPIVLLKGGAYLMADLPPARGRLSADLDIMVPAGSLAAVEAALLEHGWEPTVSGAYDQRYYRAYTHQIPPLRHPARGTELDVHHTIAPPTSRARPDPAMLFENARRLPNSPLLVLSPPDMVLHSAVHLFNEEITDIGLRDLLDLHDLVTYFGDRQDFWTDLVARARHHGLGRPLYYCLRYTAACFGTRVPDDATSAVAAFAPPPPVRLAMDWLMSRALAPAEAAPGAIAGPARWLLYVRSHWLRMPAGLLARHLATKAYLNAARDLRHWRGDRPGALPER